MFDMPETEAKAGLILRAEWRGSRPFVAKPRAQRRRSVADSVAPAESALPAEIKLASAKKVDLVIETRKAATGPAWTINGALTKGYQGPPLQSGQRNPGDAGLCQQVGSGARDACSQAACVFCMTSMTDGSPIGATA
jgi:hypothetical protein